MKFQNLSVKRLFGRVAIGLALSMSGITIALFLVTKQIAVLLTGGTLLLCALVGIFVLTQAFGKRLSQFTADELLAGTDTAKTESKTAQAQMLILELLADGKRMPSAELEKAVNERGISSRTMRTAKSRIGDRLVTEKDGTAWVCYLRD